MYSISMVNIPRRLAFQQTVGYEESMALATAGTTATSRADAALFSRLAPSQPPVYLSGALLIKCLQDSLSKDQLKDKIDELTGKLHLQRLAEDRATIVKDRALFAEERATIAEDQAKRADGRAEQAEKRATIVIHRAVLAEERATIAEDQATRADSKATRAEERANNAEHRAVLAEERATIAEEQAMRADSNATRAEERATVAEHRATKAEEKARRFEDRFLDAAAKIEILKMELAQVRLERDPAQRHLQNPPAAAVALSPVASPCLPGWLFAVPDSSSPLTIPAPITSPSPGPVTAAGQPTTSVTPVTNPLPPVNTPPISKPAPAAVAVANSNTGVQAPSPRGAAVAPSSSSPSSTSSYVWTNSDLTMFHPSGGSVVLGSGSYGTVYLCRHRVTRQPVAVKTFALPSSVSRMTKKIEAIQEEADLLDLFGREEFFPAYLGCLEVGTGYVGLAMEFVGDATTGVTWTLDKAFRGNPSLSRSDWLRLALDVTNGLQIIHAKGYLLNDLKGDNVLLHLSPSGLWRAKIIDLGLASRLSSPVFLAFTDQEKAEYRRGEVYQHIAPEVVLNDQATDVLSDVFQLGLLMRTMGVAGGIRDLIFLGNICCHGRPSYRPALGAVITGLETVK